MPRLRRGAALGMPIVLACALRALGGVSTSAGAAGYGTWTFAHGSGTLTVPAAGFPSAQVQTDASAAQVNAGSSTFLGPGTPFGGAFGSSQGEQYAPIRPAPGNQPSTTTG